MSSTPPFLRPRQSPSTLMGSAILLMLAFALTGIGVYPGLLLPPLAALIVGLWLLQRGQNKLLSFSGWSIALLSGVVMAIYRPDGFSYPQLFAVDSLYPGGKPYTQFINLGKLLGGIAVAMWLLLPRLKEDMSALCITKNWAGIAAGVVAVMLPAMLILELNLAPKPGVYIALFLVSNLLLTCFSEEVFYRLLVQQPATAQIQKKYYGAVFGVTCATAFFMLTHFTLNAELALVMGIAGFAYAMVFCLTNSVLASILTHFLVNAIHFAFLSYPL